MRSRRAAVILVLYLAGSMLACNGFITVLHRLEQQLAEMLGLSAATSPGAVVEALWQNREFQRMLRHLVGDRETASQLLSVPPMALIYGWLAFTFTPMLVMLGSSSRIAEEVSTGSIRFVMLRTSRLSWCLGKFVGQALMLVVALLLSVIGAWCIARFRLTGLNDATAGAAMLLMAGKAWVYALAFLGLALGLSQLTRHAYLAMALGFLAWIVSSFAGMAARHLSGEGVRQVWDLVGMLIPQGHRIDLWRTDLPHTVSGFVFLLALGLTYLMAGHIFFSRRDL